MNRIINKLSVALLLATSLTSCQKFLERKPINTATDGNFWNNEAEANNAMAGTYALTRTSLMEQGMSHYYYGDFATDEFMSNLPGEDINHIGNINWGFFIPATELHRGLLRLRRWDNFYRAIDQANRCLQNIPGIPVDQFTSANRQAAKDALVAEAYFLRAFNYFYMARIWGDVPLVTESVADAALAPNLERTPQAEILNLCIKDLEAALPKMTWAAASANRPIRASKGAAYALLAHIYAWKGEYDKVIVAADSVISKGGYTYVNRSNGTTYLSIFKGNTTEGIFEIAKNSNTEGSGHTNPVIGDIAFRTLKTPYLATNLGNSQFTLDVGTLNNLFPNTADSNDYRRKNGFAYWGTVDPINIKYSNIIYTAANNTSPINLNNIIVFRLADIKLLKAEALAAQSTFGEARTLLNEIRSINNVSAYTGPDNTLFETVIEERARELFLEGHRFYDLIRLARKTGTLKFNGTGAIVRMDGTQFQQGKYYWPVDPILIQLNTKLTQTPFWRDKM
ncbi:RagB/SusD family nutrient uptake outer membrane protein [Paraflavitalea pollutisoli]|uniref:RagB/SusD family nutrient uptake outer membrane protein n=1 Tax=Paraflavitalea pollutisoli TaxID=3034143 RepID=UPI0023EBF948|nr:RagB/SusD family nutrient uptake outer membrane protein [Paraflavitalea sp. H1-2-19X]